MNQYHNIQIAYYTGTGCTEMVARCFVSHFEKRGCNCSLTRITHQVPPHDSSKDLLMLLFPVHAFNAPGGVYHWIKQLSPIVDHTDAAVISVSAGGEISPNTACRVSSINKLKSKGYHTIYESMIVMPSNWTVANEPPIDSLLIHTLPQKTQKIVNDLLTGRQKRSRPLAMDRVFSHLGELEKTGAKLWGKGIKPLAHCNGCSWCAKACPAGNITMNDGTPFFGGSCHMCLKCIYGCPKKALEPAFFKSAIIKDGFSIRDIQTQAKHAGNINVNQIAKGYANSGIVKYLTED